MVTFSTKQKNEKDKFLELTQKAIKKLDNYLKTLLKKIN